MNCDKCGSELTSEQQILHLQKQINELKEKQQSEQSTYCGTFVLPEYQKINIAKVRQPKYYGWFWGYI